MELLYSQPNCIKLKSEYFVKKRGDFEGDVCYNVIYIICLRISLIIYNTEQPVVKSADFL